MRFPGPRYQRGAVVVDAGGRYNGLWGVSPRAEQRAQQSIRRTGGKDRDVAIAGTTGTLAFARQRQRVVVPVGGPVRSAADDRCDVSPLLRRDHAAARPQAVSLCRTRPGRSRPDVARHPLVVRLADRLGGGGAATGAAGPRGGACRRADADRAGAWVLARGGVVLWLRGRGGERGVVGGGRVGGGGGGLRPHLCRG
jgi:hypothetical protein